MTDKPFGDWTIDDLEAELSEISEALSGQLGFTEWLDLLHDHVQITLELTRRGEENVPTD